MAEEIDVAYVANLARLRLTREESALFAAQLRDVLHYVGKLSEVDVSGADPSAHAVPRFNIFREDDAQGTLTQEQALANAPQQAAGLFIVPKVVE